MPTPEEFAAAGLYDAADPEHSGRIELLNWLDEQGFTIPEMIDGLESDGLQSMASDRLLRSGDRLTLDSAADVAGLRVDELEVLARAFGFAPVRPATALDFTRPEIDAIALFAAASAMFSEAEMVSFFRVIGFSLGRIAEAGVTLFLSDVEAEHLSSGGSELGHAHKIDEATALVPAMADQLGPILQRHVFQAVDRFRQSMLPGLDRFQFRYAVGFVDLVGFTEIAGRLHARDLTVFLRDFEGRAHDVVTAHGARVVKLIGDEVMFVSTDPAAACRAGQALMEGLWHEDERVLPRGGLAFGEVLVRGGDYYGSVVNLASRLVDEAVPQEMLVTEELADAAEGCVFEPAGRRMVKGFEQPIAVRTFVR
jgi:class 3 adenylate cyclase